MHKEKEAVMNMTNKTKPAHEIRLGAIKAAIWKNETNNIVRFNATFTRLYRDQDKWKNSDSYGRDDLLALAKVADFAHTWICRQGMERENG
jgi:hypothetical protein